MSVSRHALAEYRELEANGGWPTVPAGATLKPGGTRRARAGARRAPRRHGRAAGRRPPSTDTSTTTRSSHGRPAVSSAPRARARRRRRPCDARGAQRAGRRAHRAAARESRARSLGALRPRERVLGRQHRGISALSPAPRRGRLAHARAGRRPYRQTPIFRAEMTYLVVNPTWTVPPTIYRNDILPAAAPRSGLSRRAQHRRVRLERRARRSGRRGLVRRATPPYRLVQRPGPDNALGRIKFMFPNEHAVYLHDTPSRDLFERDSRAFSSGCIRVENPFELAEQLLAARGARERLDAVVASGRTADHFSRQADADHAAVLDGRARRRGASLVPSRRLRARPGRRSRRSPSPSARPPRCS